MKSICESEQLSLVDRLWLDVKKKITCITAFWEVAGFSQWVRIEHYAEFDLLFAKLPDFWVKFNKSNTLGWKDLNEASENRAIIKRNTHEAC